MDSALKVLPILGQDRAIALPTSGGYLVALADGAGGSGGGAVAAEYLVATASKLNTASQIKPHNMPNFPEISIFSYQSMRRYLCRRV